MWFLWAAWHDVENCQQAAWARISELRQVRPFNEKAYCGTFDTHGRRIRSEAVYSNPNIGPYRRRGLFRKSFWRWRSRILIELCQSWDSGIWRWVRCCHWSEQWWGRFSRVILDRLLIRFISHNRLVCVTWCRGVIMERWEEAGKEPQRNLCNEIRPKLRRKLEEMAASLVTCVVTQGTLSAGFWCSE